MSTRRINSAKDLNVYKRAYALSMEIFTLSRSWPPEERYSLIDQIRRSSRSVCANLREAWSKRRYEGHFISKMTDCDGENSETNTWIDYAKDCGYISVEQHVHLVEESEGVGRMIGKMLKDPSSFLITSGS